MDARTAVVIVVRNGAHRLERTLEHLLELPEAPQVVVADNASTDGTPAFLRERFAAVPVVEVGENLGAVGRNLGVAAADAPYVAFAEDDRW